MWHIVNSNLSTNAKMIGVILGSYNPCEWNDLPPKMSLETLSEKTSIKNITTLKKALKELENEFAGYCEVVEV
ncbi:MAG: helix-turn-helix domain-containing protein [Oscillospiraceae bacterium]|nr:helix-turn-helix domain-containing protein [Oscillospiraceae bacterium]